MNITINIQPLLDFLFGQPVWLVVLGLLWRGGWVLLLVLLLVLYSTLYLKKKRKQYAETLSWTILAIDVPRENLQTLMAIEQVFAGLSGAYEKIKFLEKWRQGKFQLSFSFEIVSLDGYIQFLVRTPTQYRDLVEAVIFAHYADAEIVEVHDYTHRLPHEFPNDTHDLWGGDIILAENTALPLRTHVEFEDKVSGEVKDPIAPLLEVFSKLQQGEELWLQVVITPNDGSWKEHAQELVSELIGEVREHKPTIFNKIGDLPVKLLTLLGDSIFPGESEQEESTKDDGPQNKLSFLTPGKKDVVAAIEAKAAKIGFDTMIRLVYIARKEIFSKARAVSAVSTLHQFGTLHKNIFKIGYKTKGNKFWRKIQSWEETKTHILHEYTERAPHGSDPKNKHQHFVLNIEELATIWHFPVEFVKTPLIQKTEAKKGEPPFRLPVEINGPAAILPANGHETTAHQTVPPEHKPKKISHESHEKSQHITKKSSTKNKLPDNLPIV